MQNQVIQKSFDWIALPSGEGFLQESEYCATRDVFQARLDHLRIHLEKKGSLSVSLLIAVLGEIGNNAYDHNLGNWRDVPGTYMASDHDRKIFVIADRGQGIRTTIARVRPDVANDQEALRIAFTENISGRAPEQRGNGLKFVKSVVEQERWNLECYSGNAMIRVTTQETAVQENKLHAEGSITIVRV